MISFFIKQKEKQLKTTLIPDLLKNLIIDYKIKSSSNCQSAGAVKSILFSKRCLNS